MRFKIDWSSLIVESRFIPRGVYIWRGLYMEGLIFGILRYFCYLCDTNFLVFVAELSVHVSGCEMAHLLARSPSHTFCV